MCVCVRVLGEGGRERGIMDNDNRLETEARGKKADQTE